MIAAYASYYERPSEVWNGRTSPNAPLVGLPALLEWFFEVVESIRWPADELSDAQVRGARIKARVESERPPRGADPSTHLKLGPGGLSDVEWTVQLCSPRTPLGPKGLRTTRTPDALEAAADAGLLTAGDRSVLLAAGGWRRRFATPPCR